MSAGLNNAIEPGDGIDCAHVSCSESGSDIGDLGATVDDLLTSDSACACCTVRHAVTIGSPTRRARCGASGGTPHQQGIHVADFDVGDLGDTIDPGRLLAATLWNFSAGVFAQSGKAWS